MRAITVPYSLYRGHPSPIVPVHVRGPKGWEAIWVYVDSGAFVSIFADAEARSLGLDLEAGQLTYSIVGDGAVELNARIGFSPRLGVGFNLLGRQDIFTRFDVTFSDSRQRISFKPVR